MSGSFQPNILVRMRKSGDLDMMLKAQRVSPARHAELAGYPGIVSKCLIIKHCFGDGHPVAVWVHLLAVDKPIA